ncbi:MAG: DMT family transporter [Pseudomonadota bacterium]
MTPPQQTAPGALNWALLLLLSVIWGTAFMGVEIALRGQPPMWVAAGRTGLAALILTTAGQALGQGLSSISGRRRWLFVAAFGMTAAALPFTLLSWGQQHVPSAFAGVSMGTVPLLTLLLVMVFSPEEGIGPRRIIGVVLGFIGLLVLVGPGALEQGSSLTLWGRLACVASAACYAAGNVLTRRAPVIQPIAMAAGGMVVATFILVPAALLTDGLPTWPNAGPGAALLWVAIGPTAIAAFLQVRVIRSAGSLFMSQVSYLVPLWSVVFGITLLGEDLPPQLFIALALILTGIGFGQWSTLRRR